MASRIDDALDALSARELEEMARRIERRLTQCAMDPSHDGAVPVRITFRPPGHAKSTASLMLCPACIERHRLPAGRAESAS